MGKAVSAGWVALLVTLAFVGVARATCPDSPQPEICNGVDDDCDLLVDEDGPPPDGVTGTADPLDGTRHIGDPCGIDVGECRKGQLICNFGGRVKCLGTQDPQPEVCDCLDNDCDGEIDEIDADAGTPLCGPGTTCVALTSSSSPMCTCTSECDSAQPQCPPDMPWCVPSSRQDGSGSGSFCWPYVRAICETMCQVETVRSSTGQLQCSPNPEDGVSPCTCLEDGTCDRRCKLGSPPCLGRTMCAMATGNCEPLDSCWFTGCAAGLGCTGGQCKPNSIVPDAAAPHIPDSGSAGGAGGARGGQDSMTRDAETAPGGAQSAAGATDIPKHGGSSANGGCGCRVKRSTQGDRGAALLAGFAALIARQGRRVRRRRG